MCENMCENLCSELLHFLVYDILALIFGSAYEIFYFLVSRVLQICWGILRIWKVCMRRKTFSSIMITGASSETGAALCRQYADEATRNKRELTIFLVSRRTQFLQTTARSIKGKFVKPIVLTCDVSDRDKMAACFDQADSIKKLDCVIINASLMTTKYWDNYREVVNTNFLGAMNTIMEAVKLFQNPGRRTGRTIAIICSARAWSQGWEPCPVYGGTKSGLLSTARALQQRLEKYKIDVNIILPTHHVENANTTSIIIADEETPYERRFREEPETNLVEDLKFGSFTADSAATEIRRAIGQNRKQYTFPRRMYYCLKAESYLQHEYLPPF